MLVAYEQSRVLFVFALAFSRSLSPTPSTPRLLTEHAGQCCPDGDVLYVGCVCVLCARTFRLAHCMCGTYVLCM